MAQFAVVSRLEQVYSGIFDNLLDFSIFCQNNAKDQYVGYSTY